MTQTEQQKAAKEFSLRWAGKGYEKGESQKFWLDLLCNIFGIQNFASFVYFENQIKDTFQDKTITNFIDVYIPSTKVMIEQKSSNKDLREAIKQSDGTLLNPFQQAKKYIAGLPLSQHPKWVVTCNFKQFLVYDMENPNGGPQEILLENLEKEFYRLSFLTNTGSEHLKKEMEISIKAGDIVGKIYDQLYPLYEKVMNDQNKEALLHSLNMLCVRLVFCLYAEDSGLFGHKSMFGDFLKRFEARDIRKNLIDLFKILDTKIGERDPFMDEELAKFPYVNGELFSHIDNSIPQFTEELKELLINKASQDFDWSEISPTIFGAVFESTLNPETRRSGGMHYTSIENIHKVIDPLFMDELNEEFEKLEQIKTEKKQTDAVIEFQKKLGGLKFLDPACGSGNFLTETYLSLRKLENKCLRLRFKESVLDVYEDTIFVNIHQFYGIEINDFATVVAKTALWIAESQMMKETSKILGRNLNFLPLKSYANITEGNALRTDWESVCPKAELNYIMGNPPFVGARLMSSEQKQDVLDVWGNVKNIGNVDYVSCWYKKCADMIQNTQIRCALVSTNSITQGEQVAIMWKPLMKQGIEINFAYKTFRWDSEASLKAHVHCVIVGFSCHSELDSESKKLKKIFLNDNQVIEAENINGYLVNADNVFIENRNKPICNVPEIGIGNKPIDGGNYLFLKKEKEAFIKKQPEAEKYFKPWYGSDEFINRRPRYCLWLGDCTPNELRKMKYCLERVENVRNFRLASKSEGTRKIADKPTRFHVENMPASTYLLIPRVSSERRRYIPIGFMQPTELTSDSCHLIPNATLYEFGVLTSNVHMSWMRAVCGRLKSDYRYSKDIVYNNFPWCKPTDEQKAKIEKTAQAILDARANYPDSSLADLYDETTMPADLRKAHQENDRAVMQAYGFPIKDFSESECVARLFEMYERMVKN